MPTDNQENGKKWLMPIGLKYQGYGASNNDVWTINSYYRISDERGQWNCSGYSQTEIISEKEIYLT